MVLVASSFDAQKYDKLLDFLSTNATYVMLHYHKMINNKLKTIYYSMILINLWKCAESEQIY